MKGSSVACLVINNFVNDSRVMKECATLRKDGHDTFVVALHDKNLPQREYIGGVSILRLRLYSRNWSKHRLVQILKYIEWLIRAVWHSRKADVLHCNDLGTLPVGVFVKRAINRKAKVVYDAHEYETETNGLYGVEKRLKRWLERRLIRHADKVITVSDSIANEYRRLYAIPKPHLILNCPAYQDVKKQDRFRDEIGIRKDQTIFLYQGGLLRGRGIELLLEAFEQLNSDENVIVFMGYGSLGKYIQHHAKVRDTVFFREAVSPSILLNYTASADFGISFIEDSCLSYRYCLPNKMFEYLMAGIPVLTSNLYEMKRLVEEYGVGVVADKNTVEGFIDAMKCSVACDYQEMLKNVNAARSKFNWEAQAEVLRTIYAEL